MLAAELGVTGAVEYGRLARLRPADSVLVAAAAAILPLVAWQMPAELCPRARRRAARGGAGPGARRRCRRRGAPRRGRGVRGRLARGAEQARAAACRRAAADLPVSGGRRRRVVHRAPVRRARAVPPVTWLRRFQSDMDAVGAAGQAGRLYVPTRSLPEDYDVPHPFATAPVSRCQVLHEAYRAALDASVQAARALDELSIAAAAPSKALALARAAASAQSSRRGSQPRPDDGIPGDPPLSGTPFTHSRAATGRPGPVEQAITARRVSDPVILLRAAAIDNAARQLITQAENTTSASSSPDTPTNIRRPASSAAQLAAQSFPYDLTARPKPRLTPARSFRDDNEQRASGTVSRSAPRCHRHVCQGRGPVPRRAPAVARRPPLTHLTRQNGFHGKRRLLPGFDARSR